MFWVCIVVIVIFSLFLILLCLVQSSKKENSSGGIVETSGFSQVIGIKKTFDVLEKLTLSSAFIVFLFSVVSHYSLTSRKNKKMKINLPNDQKTEEPKKD